MHRLAYVLVRNQDFLVDTGILGHHEGNTAFLEEAANDLFGTVLEHFNNFAFPATTVIHLVNPRSYTVTVKHLAHLTRGEKQVGTAIIRNQETEAVPMPDHPAGYQVCFFYRQERIPSVTNQLRVAAHGNQPAAKGFYTFLRSLPKLLAQSLMGGRCPQLSQVPATKHQALDGDFVFLSLTTGGAIFELDLPGNHSDPCYLPAILRRNSLSLQYNVGMSNLPNQGTINRHKYGENFF